MIADIVTILILLAIGGYSIYTIIRDKRNGVPSCGYACGECGGSCHSGKPDKATKKQVRAFKKHLKEREAEKS